MRVFSIDGGGAHARRIIDRLAGEDMAREAAQ
jgi:hypothetical protein